MGTPSDDERWERAPLQMGGWVIPGHQFRLPLSESACEGGSLEVHSKPGEANSEATFGPTTLDMWSKVPLSEEAPAPPDNSGSRDTQVVTVPENDLDQDMATIRPSPAHDLTFTVKLFRSQEFPRSIVYDGDSQGLLKEGGVDSGLAAMTNAGLWIEDATVQITREVQASGTPSRTPQGQEMITFRSSITSSTQRKQEAFVHLSRDSIDFLLNS